MADEIKSPPLTFLHARLFAMTGKPVKRRGWEDKWLTFESGFWLINTAAEARVIEADTLTPADFYAADWHYPDGCTPAPIGEPLPFPRLPGASAIITPSFDVANPPCSQAA